MIATLHRFVDLILVSSLLASFILVVDLGTTPVASAQDVCAAAARTSLTGAFNAATANGANVSANGTVTNTSASCSYQVGIATYMLTAPSLQGQILFNHSTATVGPNGSVTLSANLPVCAAQVDIFQGPVLTSVPEYGTRLLAYTFVTGTGFCTMPAPGGGSSVAPQVQPPAAVAPIVPPNVVPIIPGQFTAGGASDGVRPAPTAQPPSAPPVAAIPPVSIGQSMPVGTTAAEVAGAMALPQPPIQSAVAPSQDTRAALPVPEVAPIAVPLLPVEAVLRPVEAVIPIEGILLPVEQIELPPEVIEVLPELIQIPPAQVVPVQQVPRPVAVAPVAQPRPVQQVPAAQRLPRTGGAPIPAEAIGMLGLALLSTGLLIRRRAR